jgi:hypothetical protein
MLLPAEHGVAANQVRWDFASLFVSRLLVW